MSKSAFFVLQPNQQRRLREVAFFMMVGVLNTGIDFTILNLLTWLTNIHSGLWLPVFSCLSFSVAVINSYILNKRLTFRDKTSDNSQKFVRFVGVNLVGMAINAAIVWLLAPQFAKGLSPIAAVNVSKGFATIVSLTWNYLVARQWVFKTHITMLDHGSLAVKNQGVDR